MPKLGANIFKSSWPFLLLVCAFSFFSWKALLLPGFFEVHDYQQVARLSEMDKALNDGQFPVRWVSELGFGYGYPLFNFYPPLSYYSGEVVHKISGLDAVTSVKTVYLLALVLSGLSMFFLAREFFGRWGGFLSALFYIYAPYHAVDLYVRGALAETTAFIWLPLGLLFSYRLAKYGRFNDAIWLALTLGALMLSHQLIFLAFVPFLLIWSVCHVFREGENKLQKLFLLGGGLILGLGLAAFFWLPAILEKGFTLVDQISIQNLNSYAIHFVCPGQLWNSPWGYGGSVKGCVDGLSFQVGKLHLLLAASSLVIMIYLFIKRNFKIFTVLLLASALLLASLFMTTSYSKLIWEIFPPFWYLQFPWRFLTIGALFVSLLVGAVVVPFKNSKIKALIAVLGGVLVIVLTAKYFVPHLYYSPEKSAEMTTINNIKWQASQNAFEYLPSGFATRVAPNGDIVVDVTRDSVAKEPYIVDSQKYQIQDSGLKSNTFWLRGKFLKSAKVTFSVTNFPGWNLYLDQKKISINDQNKYKLISAEIPAGSHNIVGVFNDTPVRKLGNLLSLLAGLITGLFIVYGKRSDKI